MSDSSLERPAGRRRSREKDGARSSRSLGRRDRSQPGEFEAEKRSGAPTFRSLSLRVSLPLVLLQHRSGGHLGGAFPVAAGFLSARLDVLVLALLLATHAPEV